MIKNNIFLFYKEKSHIKHGCESFVGNLYYLLFSYNDTIDLIRLIHSFNYKVLSIEAWSKNGDYIPPDFYYDGNNEQEYIKNLTYFLSLYENGDYEFSVVPEKYLEQEITNAFIKANNEE